MENGLFADRRQAHHGRNEYAASVKGWSEVAAIHVVHHAVRHILERDGDSGRLVMFQHRKIDKFVDPSRHYLTDVGAAVMRVREVLTRLDQRSEEHTSELQSRF